MARPATGPVVRLRAPRHQPRHARAADAAGGARLRRRDHRVGVPDRAGHDGATAGARQDQDPPGRHRLRGAAGRRAARAAGRRARCDLRRVCGGLVRPRRRRRAAAQPRRRSDLARPPGGLAAARRGRGARPVVADAARPRAPRCAAQCRGRLRAAQRARRCAVGCTDGRRGRGAAAPGQPLRRCTRPLSARGGGAVGARDAKTLGRDRLAGDRAPVRRAVRAHRLTGGGAEPRGGVGRDARPGGGPGRARCARCRHPARRVPTPLGSARRVIGAQRRQRGRRAGLRASDRPGARARGAALPAAACRHVGQRTPKVT